MGLPFVMLSAAHEREFLMQLPELSSLGCLPGRAGGSPALRYYRAIRGDYDLYRFPENGKFYVNDRSLRDNGGGGVLDGTVERIGWDDRYIAAWRQPLAAGDRAGWMLIDTGAKEISGPLPDLGFDVERVNGLQVRDVSDAWDELR